MNKETVHPLCLLSLDEAMTILKEMDKALAFHMQWRNALHHMLICGEPVDPAYIAHDAHGQCNFGRWYQGLPPTIQKGEPGIAHLEQPHQRMHDAARELLLRFRADGKVEPETYDAFIGLATAFKQTIREYQFDLVQRVCSVDQLTGTWNRNAMTSRLAEEAERAVRGDRNLSICLLDLDNFKLVNDKLGHPVGDQVLHFVARFLKENLRGYDSMFRYGGEEFLICLPDTSLDLAEKLIDRVREKLQETPIELPDQPMIRVTASFGVASLGQDKDISTAIERADHALLCAKAKGRNRVCAWDMAGPPPSA